MVSVMGVSSRYSVMYIFDHLFPRSVELSVVIEFSDLETADLVVDAL